MIKYVYKADNAYGEQRSGTIAAHTIGDARRILRENGLVSTFLEDAKEYRHKRRKKKRRHQMLIRIGVGLVVIAMFGSRWMVDLAGQDSGADASSLKSSGVLTGNAGTIIAETEQAEAFAHRLIDAWNNFAPRLITGVEVRENLLTLYVSNTASDIQEGDLEALASQSIRALQREFDSSGATMLVIEDDVMIMELYYNPFTKKTRVQDYR
ncbi:MAG: hypothetical protein VCD00_17500 [Candidatus Hydrogenedentota bacterium]